MQIQENGNAATALLGGLNGKIVPGKAYDEQIRAKNNTSDADQFVRIVVRKYWKDAAGNKAKDVDQKVLDKIQLTFANPSLWQKNNDETTAEREVYYYRNIVPAGGVTEPLTSTLTVDSSVALEYTVAEPDANKVIRYSYDYDGYQVCIEAEAQSIQTHNARAAIRSIWGVTNVTASGSTLTVAN